MNPPALKDSATAWALHHCASAGWEPVQELRRATLFRGPEGQQCLVSVLAFDLPRHPGGDPAVIERLRDALDGVMGQRRYLFHIRQLLPADLDPEPVARAVHLWLMAIERGDWQGRHAVYEDDGISLEISLTGETAPVNGRPSMLWVRPLVGMDRASTVAQDISTLLFDLEDEADPELPLVVVLAAAPGWGLSRGNMLQALYGLPDLVCSGPDTSEASFAQAEHGLFADPMSRRLCALWWVEEGQEADTLRGWATDNPWCDEPHSAPVFSGRRLLARVRPDGLGLGPATLAWEGRMEDWRRQP